MTLSLALVLHAHQPVENFDHVVEQAYQSAYRPFVEEVEKHPRLRFTLHFSGWLLQWIADRHPEYIGRLRGLIEAQRLEVLGGGYFEPILAAIPERDRQEQLRRLSGLVQRLFAVTPRGAWLAERVWEPDLPSTLAAAQLEYTIVDDTHLILAGLEPEQTYGFYWAEHGGHAIQLVPANKFLRFAIPFRPEPEALQFLAEIGRSQPGALLTMADDLEKFGAWPHTHEHVIRGGWLRRFCDLLDSNADWLETVRLGDYLAGGHTRGLVYPPTAAYEEMMQWALPAPAAELLGQAWTDARIAPYRRFLTGAPWRSFLAKYPEAYALHAFALNISRRLATRAASRPAADCEPAWTRLLAAQCNDVYWHGLFGGLYAPHLRNAAYTHLLQADTQLAQWEGSAEASLRRGECLADGGETVELRTAQLRLVVQTGDGGSVAEIDSVPAAANLVNALQRRPEAYHQHIRAKVAANPAQLPGAAATPDTELEALLQYDRYRRSCHRLYLFPAFKTMADFLRLDLGEDQPLAAGPYSVATASEAPLCLSLTAAGGRVRKTFAVASAGAARMDCHIEAASLPPGNWAGIEMVFNLLAPGADDRAIVAGGRRLPLDWQGELPPGPLEFEDGWRGIRIRLEAPGARHWWLRPIHTVSQSEAGFEKVYQGSAVMAVWESMSGSITLITDLHPLPK